MVTIVLWNTYGMLSFRYFIFCYFVESWVLLKGAKFLLCAQRPHIPNFVGQSHHHNPVPTSSYSQHGLLLFTVLEGFANLVLWATHAVLWEMTTFKVIGSTHWVRFSLFLWIIFKPTPTECFLCAWNCTKTLCIHDMTSFNHHSILVDCALALCLFYRWNKWGRERVGYITCPDFSA